VLVAWTSWTTAVIGDLDGTLDSSALPADPGSSLAVNAAEPGSPSAERMTLLAPGLRRSGTDPRTAMLDELP
jgi:hypothetical protein